MAQTKKLGLDIMAVPLPPNAGGGDYVNAVKEVRCDLDFSLYYPCFALFISIFLASLALSGSLWLFLSHFISIFLASLALFVSLCLTLTCLSGSFCLTLSHSCSLFLF
jgi:hypothetical protein